MKRTFTYTTTKTQTIGTKLKSLGYSQGLIAHLKRTKDGILKNGDWAKVSDTLSSGDLLTINLIFTQMDQNITPVALAFEIIYEDQDLMVINKPSNMPIHPSIHNRNNTLANGLMDYFQKKSVVYTYHCINRLDRDTTGLLIIAKHKYSAALLSEMMLKREIKRTYLGIVSGTPPTTGVIDAPIARKPGSTIEREVNHETGDCACTHFDTLIKKKEYSLLSLRLETGRTHQIRVHMKYANHPLIGDFLYYPDFTHINRQALHSYKLSFLHPITKEELTFYAPLPFDMHTLFKDENIPLL